MEKWRQIQKGNFTRLEDLANFLELDLNEIAKASFPLNFPFRLAQKVEKGDLKDPILLQFLPRKEEHLKTLGFTKDPVNDCSFQKTPRLLQKYEGRALLITTSACVMNCRFCFRQNYPYDSRGQFEEELETLKSDPSIHEVILSGGDPLSLSDVVLINLIEAIDEIPHIKLLRFHSRFPLGIPERITPALIKCLKKMRMQGIFILHTNHPKELDDAVFASLKSLEIPILTQTVLLRGINDDHQTLKELFLKLAFQGIIPYYLHQLDKVDGASHFEVPIEVGKKLVSELQNTLPGYAVPTYVQEVPFEKCKSRITSGPLS